MVSETKIDNNFPFGNFVIGWFSAPCRLHRDNGGGIILYVTEDIPSDLLATDEREFLS